MNKPLHPIAQTLSKLGLVQKQDLIEICQSNNGLRSILTEIFDRKLSTSHTLSKHLSQCFGTPLFEIRALDPSVIPLDLIDFKLVERHWVLPFYRHDKKLYVAMVDPTNSAALDEIKFYTGLQIVPIQVELHALQSVISKLDELQGQSLEDFIEDDDIELDIADEDDPGEASDLDFNPNEAPIVRYVNKILVDAINRGASDIHIEPFDRELRVRFRIDGILHTIATQPMAFANRIVARIKILSRLDIAERRVPQDGRVKLKVSKSKAFDFRISTLPTLYGEKVVMRILDSGAANLDLKGIGLTEQQLMLYKQVVERPYGMVLITGPTGCGKTVTLYSALNLLNSPSKNISTVEDPVEIQLTGITQVNINEKANLGFANTLRAFLRQDPDIIMLGEIRDLETAEIAVKASQTGHMVLSTLHTNDAPSTLTRLLNMGVPAFNVASAVHLVIAQRLVRKLCTHCKEPVEYPNTILLDAGFASDEVSGLEIFGAHGEGCEHCTDGYRGRTGVFEVMPISEEIKAMIMQGCTEHDIQKQTRKEGTLDLRSSGLLKVRSGVTSLDEIERLTNV